MLLKCYHRPDQVKEYRKNIKTFIFDYDGVFTNNTIWLFEDGSQVRTGNTQDGFAIKRLVEEGYNVAILSGANSEGIRKRMEYLGVKDIFLGVSDKLSVFSDYINEKGVEAKDVLYMGDDIPDAPVLKVVGLPVIPADAKVNFRTRTRKNGGEGCVREIIEEFINLYKSNDARN
jgi:3-deoxy-D-manno-octulosonate 8-phosphate phosphatase (KDO 8-P phosphatase)